jgi:hypothetical protein
MSEQPGNTDPQTPQEIAAELYQRANELTWRLKTNSQDQEAQAEFAELKATVEGNPEISAEFVRLRKAGRKPPSSATSKSEKQEGSTGTNDDIEEVFKGFGVLKNYNRTGQREVQEKVRASSQGKQESNQFISWTWGGEVIDFWSDLIEGKGDKREAFVIAYRKIVWERDIDGVDPRPIKYAAGNLLSRMQTFEAFRWKVARAALRTEQMGNDLYVSWRVFVKEPISGAKIILWLAGCVLLGMYLTVGTNFQYFFSSPQTFGFSSGTTFIPAATENSIKVVIVTSVLFGLIGIFRKRGDVFGLFRRPLDEFDRDDATAAGHIIHKSLLQAADAVGIDSMSLAPKYTPPVERPRSRPRI